MNNNIKFSVSNASSAEAVALARGGRRARSGWLCCCPVPTHGRRRGDINPSLSVRDGDHNLLVKCHAGCDPLDVLNALRSMGHGAGCVDPLATPAARPANNDNAEALRRRAEAIWNGGRPAAGSVIETYLRRRGVMLPIPSSIRSGLAWMDGTDMPVMLAAVQDGSGAVIAVQPYLTPDGCKAGVGQPRLNSGKLGDGAVRLAESGPALGMAEGTETALAAMQLTGIPCWAALGEGRLAKIAIPPEVRELHIFGDADRPGRRGADAAAEHHHAVPGREVILRFPPRGHKDFADIVERKSKEAA
jgi:putative DNA primase/helicase